MNNFPTIQTERLILNQPLHTDVPDIVRYIDHPIIYQNTLNIPRPYFEKDAIIWLGKGLEGFKDGTIHRFAIRLKEDPTFIGAIGLIVDLRHNRAEVGYWIAEPFWNQGYMTEALAVMLRYGFTKVELQKIIATYIPTNVASSKVMEKCGMIKEGELKDHTRKDGVYQTVIQYRLTKDEYLSL